MLTRGRPELEWFEAISGIYIKTKKLTEEALKPHDLTWPQYGALMVMTGSEPLSQRELANAMEADTTTAMVICDSLEKKGLIERRRDHNDRRINRLHVTSSGGQRFSAASVDVMSRYGRILGDVSQGELASISPVLSRLYGVVSEIYDEEIHSKEVS